MIKQILNLHKNQRTGEPDRRKQGVVNGWTEKVREQREEIEKLRAKVLHKENLLDAMRVALAAREKTITFTLADLAAEKKANLSWVEFADHACMELKDWREIAGHREGD